VNGSFAIMQRILPIANPVPRNTSLEGQRVAWLLKRSYKPPKRSAQADGIESLAFRFHLLRLFAALNSTSLAHVIGLASSASAASYTCCLCFSVMGMRIPAVLRSLGSLGGLPIRFFSMSLNIYRNSLESSLVMPTNNIYNKYRQRKTPVKPWRALTGRIIRLVAESS
jgi:hypothetical protein